MNTDKHFEDLVEWLKDCGLSASDIQVAVVQKLLLKFRHLEKRHAKLEMQLSERKTLDVMAENENVKKQIQDLTRIIQTIEVKYPVERKR